MRLYDGLGNVLASATITTSDPQEGSPVPFYSQAITPVLLAANTTYYIAEDWAATTTGYGLVTGLTTNSAITYDGAVSAFGQGNDPTTDINGGSDNPAYFGPNFDISTASVPEPSTLVGGITALTGSLICAWRCRKRAA